MTRYKRIELECRHLPFKDFGSNKTKPLPTKATVILTELLDAEVIGTRDSASYYMSFEDFAKSRKEANITDNYYISHFLDEKKILDSLPVLAHIYYVINWKEHTMYKPWKRALEIFRNLRTENKIRSWEDWFKIQGKAIEQFVSTSKSPEYNESIALVFYSIIVQFLRYYWSDRNSIAFQDYLMIHRLIYFLSLRSFLIPQVRKGNDEDKKKIQEIKANGSVLLSMDIGFEKPDFEQLAKKDDYYWSEKKLLEDWIHLRATGRNANDFFLLDDGFLNISRFIYSTHINRFPEQIMKNLLGIVIEAFTQEEPDFFSSGQNFVGVCRTCGRLFHRRSFGNYYCKNSHCSR